MRCRDHVLANGRIVHLVEAMTNALPYEGSMRACLRVRGAEYAEIIMRNGVAFL